MAQIQRLRTPLEGVDYTVNAERNIAALTICNLMLDAKELNADILQLRQQVEELQAKISNLSMDSIQRLDDEIADRR